MAVAIRALPTGGSLLTLAHAIPKRYPCLLHSASSGNVSARYDVLFAFPEDELQANSSEIFLSRLDTAFAAQKIPHSNREELPFFGGWALLLNYELAAELEPKLGNKIPKSQMRAAIALRCPAAIIVDRLLDRVYAIAERGRESLVDELEKDYLQLGQLPQWKPFSMAMREDDPQIFLEGVKKILDYLHAGDVFQVNLSRAWRGEISADVSAAQIFAALCAANPAPFAGLFQYGDDAVLSSSPERLVKVLGDWVDTRPIAGTRPRGKSLEDDLAMIAELRSNLKERAEHIMLIDLERNDLGRICQPGSINVNELMGVETYTHVHHIVSNVQGRLRADVTPGEVIAAVFPGGTITGCPKVRCMEIIAELEQTPRGPYTGAMGYLNRDGSMDLNILIRTIWMHGQQISIRAGAGIVADSIAERELQETRDKARGMLRALGALEARE